MIAPAAVSASDLARLLARLCPENHIDLAGAVTLPCPLPHASKYREWLAAERHGGLDYLAREPEERLDPTRRRPWARSLLVFAQTYTQGWPKEPESDFWLGGVARYARGLDYHDVLLADARAVTAGLAESLPGCRADVVTDTGPFLEREYAWLAGLGFLGRNRSLIHERLGSGLLLAVAPCSLEIDGLSPAGEAAEAPLWAVVPRPGRGAPVSRCGRCDACVRACPTGALDDGPGLDARRCISCWNIEWRGGAPADGREAQGARLFGCDDCQAVCPWNRKAARLQRGPRPRAQYAPLIEHAGFDLPDLLRMDTDRFRDLLRRTPLWRCHPEGMRRNALIVVANTGRLDCVEIVEELAVGDPDPRVRKTAAWTLERLRSERD